MCPNTLHKWCAPTHRYWMGLGQDPRQPIPCLFTKLLLTRQDQWLNGIHHSLTIDWAGIWDQSKLSQCLGIQTTIPINRKWMDVQSKYPKKIFFRRGVLVWSAGDHFTSLPQHLRWFTPTPTSQKFVVGTRFTMKIGDDSKIAPERVWNKTYASNTSGLINTCVKYVRLLSVKIPFQLNAL